LHRLAQPYQRHRQRPPPITADTALRLGIFFGMEARFWINLQGAYAMRVAVRPLKDQIEPRIRVFRPVSN
jgi:plasmid maintenance system antidote protein VapI